MILALGVDVLRPRLLQAYDPCLDLDRQLVGLAVGPARAVGEPFQADLVVAREDLAAGLAISRLPDSIGEVRCGKASGMFTLREVPYFIGFLWRATVDETGHYCFAVAL